MMKLAKPCQEHSFSPIVIHGAFKDDLESELILLTFMVLYMSFDKFLLAVVSSDLSQADKNIIRVSSFPNLSAK